MTALSRTALASGAIDAPHASPAPRPIEVLQIGEGVFLRAFVDWMVDVANERGVYAGGVAVAAPRRHGRPPALADQDGLYTVLLRGRENGRDISERRVVTAVQAALDPYRQWSDMLRLAASPALRFLVSNTTEAGIADAPEPYDPAACPESFPAKVAALFKARFDALGGPAAPGLVILPCELIEENGATLRRIVIGHARRPYRAGFPKGGGREPVRRMGLSRSARRRRRAVPFLGDRGAARCRRGAAARQGRGQRRLYRRHPALSRTESAAAQRNPHRKRARRLSRRARHGRRDDRRSAVFARAGPD